MRFAHNPKASGPHRQRLALVGGLSRREKTGGLGRTSPNGASILARQSSWPGSHRTATFRQFVRQQILAAHSQRWPDSPLLCWPKYTLYHGGTAERCWRFLHIQLGSKPQFLAVTFSRPSPNS